MKVDVHELRKRLGSVAPSSSPSSSTIDCRIKGVKNSKRMGWNVRREKRLRIKKSVKTREGREIVPPPFSYILLPSSTQSEINKFIPFEFGESREKEFVSRTGENFWESRKFLSAITFFTIQSSGILRPNFTPTRWRKWNNIVDEEYSFSPPKEKNSLVVFYKSPPALSSPRLESVHKIYTRLSQ